jgi:hypothetical protein
MPDLTFTVTVGGTPVPFTRFSMTGGAYGSVGHVTITTSNTALLDAKMDLFALTSGSPGFVEVDISVQQQPPDQPQAGGYSAGGTSSTSSTTKRIFGGEYLRTDWDLDTDAVTIHARDWAGVLVDQKRILTKIGKAVEKVLAPLAPGRVTVAGISNENQQVSNIVNSIAAEFGFTPVLNLSSSGRNPSVGTLYGSSDQSFITVPQSLWTILNQLARDTGYVVYVTPLKELVFGEPGAGLDTLQLCWNISPSQGQLPCKHAKIEHHPRRNSTFRVLVISYDPSHAQATIGRATYVGNAYAGQHGLTAGLSTGQAAITADKNILALQQGEANISSSQIPLYTFHVDGLNADQATMRAESIATDIAKRELILSTTIDGLPSVLPTQMIRLSGDVVSAFSEPTFYVSGYQQDFSMPDAHSHRSDAGWVTRVTALSVPTEGLAKSEEG